LCVAPFYIEMNICGSIRGFYVDSDVVLKFKAERQHRDYNLQMVSRLSTNPESCKYSSTYGFMKD
jgi:hypothetical protein